jgi:hypothetical protein
MNRWAEGNSGGPVRAARAGAMTMVPTPAASRMWESSRSGNRENGRARRRWGTAVVETCDVMGERLRSCRCRGRREEMCKAHPWPGKRGFWIFREGLGPDDSVLPQVSQIQRKSHVLSCPWTR